MSQPREADTLIQQIGFDRLGAALPLQIRGLLLRMERGRPVGASNLVFMFVSLMVMEEKRTCTPQSKCHVEGSSAGNTAPAAGAANADAEGIAAASSERWAQMSSWSRRYRSEELISPSPRAVHHGVKLDRNPTQRCVRTVQIGGFMQTWAERRMIPEWSSQSAMSARCLAIS